MRHTPSLVIIALMCSAPAFAQTTATPPANTPNQTLSLNPFGLMLEWFNVKYERKITSSATLGVDGCRTTTWMEYSNVELLARFYPQGEALKGFYLGARAGGFGIRSHRVSLRAAHQPQRSAVVSTLSDRHERTGRFSRASASRSATTGCSAAKQRVAIGLGFGLSRLLRERRRRLLLAGRPASSARRQRRDRVLRR